MIISINFRNLSYKKGFLEQDKLKKFYKQKKYFQNEFKKKSSHITFLMRKVLLKDINILYIK